MSCRCLYAEEFTRILRFCAECREKRKQAIREKESRRRTLCAGCGLDFVRARMHQKYCSDDCRAEHYANVRRERSANYVNHVFAKFETQPVHVSKHLDGVYGDRF